MQNGMPMTIHRSKSKPEIEFQYGGRPFSETDINRYQLIFDVLKLSVSLKNSVSLRIIIIIIIIIAVRLLVTEPRLAVEVYFGLTTPYQYRLVGPGAWRGARDAILSSRQRIMQPLKTRRVAMATTDNRRRSLFLPALFTAAIAASACLFYRRFTYWQYLVVGLTSYK